MTPDEKLQALFGESAPPARDYVFESAVAQRIARRRAIGSVVSAAPWAVVGASVLWGLQPLFETFRGGLESQNSVLMLVALSAGAAGGALWLVRRLTPLG